jgi:hypothetical protein
MRSHAERVNEEYSMLSHSVFFSLHDNSSAAIQRMVTACKTYLTDHPGTCFFAAGTLAGEFQRPVNDRAFDVALHVVFTDRAAHDAYQEHPRHKKFIEENSGNWKQVRVFDAWVEA